jgi:hypothetical protein
MTQQYLTGELSLLLGQLQSAMIRKESMVAVAQLRRRAETGSGSALSSVAASALEAGDRICWDSLTRGDCAGFNRQAAICAQLWEFAVCAGLVT